MEATTCKPDEGHYENNEKIPGKCHKHCLTCKDSEDDDNCLTCDEDKGYIKEDEEETSRCVPKPGTHRPSPDDGGPTVPCHDSCKTCSGSG